ncbi:DNA helicase [Tanacetum coccineum]
MMPPVELRNALIALRWSTDYLLKTVAQPHRTIVQVVNRVHFSNIKHLELNPRIEWSHLMGENLGCLNVEELKQLETTLERGISKITSKKVRQLLSGSQAGTSQCIPMFKADDNQLHADAVPEYTHSPERGVERREAQAADVQTAAINRTVTRCLPIGNHDTIDRTTVPVSRIFDRLRNMSMNVVESDYTTHTDVQHPVVSRPPLTTLNISFPNNNDENSHRSYLPAKHPRLHSRSVHNTVSATSEPSILNVYKRKYLQPLSALSSKEASSSRNIKRRTTRASSKETLQTNAAHSRGYSDVLMPLFS